MKPLSRRQMLHAVLMGGLGGLLAACSGAPVEQSVPTAAPALPTAVSAEPTAAPPAPTTAPATAAPAATAASAPTAAATAAVPTNTPPPPPTAAIAQVAQSFLESLEGERRAMATYAFDDAERMRWHWTMPSGFPRNGLPLRDMTEAQRAAALTLLQQSVSPAGYQQSLDIMSLQRDLGNDPDLYYVTVFGNPGGSDPWSWRWEGHHLSRHITAVSEKLTVTPFFHGAWPTTSDQGLRAMPREEDAARELITSLSGPVRDAAIFQSRTLSQHVTSNQPQVAPLEQVGVGYTELDSTQQGLVMEIVQSYLGSLHETASAPILGRIQAAGLEQLRFGWAGALEPRKPHYYRIQGPTFLLEFDNSRNGGTHIHSVWRDFDEDFGHHLSA